MKNPVHFYHHPWTRGGAVHWLLEELGIPYEVTLLDITKKEQKDPVYLSVNRMGKLPAIIHNEVVVTEAAAICVYLADAFAEAKLAPTIGDPDRGTYLRWIFFASGCTESALVDRNHSRPEIDPSSIGYGSYKEAFHNLRTALTPGPYILGERFSAADVYIASQISWGFMTNGIDPDPVFEQYVNKCKERPAFQRFAVQANEMIQKLERR